MSISARQRLEEGYRGCRSGLYQSLNTSFAPTPTFGKTTSKRDKAAQLINATTPQPTFGRQARRQHLQNALNNGALNPNACQNLDLSGADLRGLNLRVLGEKALRQINFTGADLSGQDFSGLNLGGARMSHTTLMKTNFAGATLGHAHMEKSLAGGANFAGVQAPNLHARGISAVGACLEGNFTGADMSDSADLRYSYIGDQTSFRSANLSHADFTGVVSCGGEPDFRRANLSNSVLNGDFTGANFSGANLTEANMVGGTFEDAIFVGTDMTDVKSDATTNMTNATMSNIIDRNVVANDDARGALVKRMEQEIPKPTLGRYSALNSTQDTVKMMRETFPDMELSGAIRPTAPRPSFRTSFPVLKAA